MAGDEGEGGPGIGLNPLQSHNIGRIDMESDRLLELDLDGRPAGLEQLAALGGGAEGGRRLLPQAPGLISAIGDLLAATAQGLPGSLPGGFFAFEVAEATAQLDEALVAVQVALLEGTEAVVQASHLCLALGDCPLGPIEGFDGPGHAGFDRFQCFQLGPLVLAMVLQGSAGRRLAAGRPGQRSVGGGRVLAGPGQTDAETVRSGRDPDPGDRHQVAFDSDGPQLWVGLDERPGGRPAVGQYHVG